ncbi:cryptococcal mannosyltransferase 1-domain-containing protein [Coprinopsis sp. MPI-PUGE-AT-0042]|nr:cryptococcal mannosyltransferase 1-domain-containing protein [Coprinopsis sp. MPI-PUGE-AT-0042]
MLRLVGGSNIYNRLPHSEPPPRTNSASAAQPTLLVLKSQARAYRRRLLSRLFSLFLASAFLLSDLDNARNLHIIHPSRIGRVFIAANHYDSEHMLESHWIPAVLGLVQALGKENVFISIAASRSPDNTLPLLWDFAQLLKKMGVENRIKLEEETHETWANHRPDTGDKGWWRRIPFLASVRNRVFEPLDDPKVVNATRGFDKVLFLNDISSRCVEDALTLLNTRGGDYGAACAMYFLIDRKFYDTFVMRDSQQRMVANQANTLTLARDQPAKHSYEDNQSLSSCWNGMTAFDAKPFHHVEASECCLIHADNPESKRKGVWVNPHVRVAYHEDAYLLMRNWPTLKDKVTGAWFNFRNDFSGMPYPKEWITNAVKNWLEEDATREGSEPGLFCLEDQMQILTAQSWQTVKKPRKNNNGRLQWKQDPWLE